MLLRVRIDEADGLATVLLHGRLDHDGVEELRRAVEKQTAPLALDLSQLLSVDEAAATYLCGLIDAGATVCAANPYVATLLRLDGSSGPDAARAK